MGVRWPMVSRQHGIVRVLLEDSIASGSHLHGD